MLVTVFIPAANDFSVCVRIKCFLLRLKPLLLHLFPRLILDLNVISSKLMFLAVFDVTKHIHLLLNLNTLQLMTAQNALLQHNYSVYPPHTNWYTFFLLVRLLQWNCGILH
jgi:hypothetical protein